MPDPAKIGLALHPSLAYLEQVAPLLARDVDILEVAPETTWYLARTGELRANRYHPEFLALGARHHLPFIAHGVGLSPGSAQPGPRRARWLARVADDQRHFNYLWYTDHLGASVLAGHDLALPLGLPMTATHAALVRDSLAAMQRIVPQSAGRRGAACRQREREEGGDAAHATDIAAKPPHIKRLRSARRMSDGDEPAASGVA